MPRTPAESRQLIAATVAEEDLQRWVLEHAERQRWRRMHALAVRRLTDWFRCTRCRGRTRIGGHEGDRATCPVCGSVMKREVRANTPIMGDPGFLDLTLVRPPRLVFAELKTESGRVRPDQAAWMADLRAVADAIVAATIGHGTPQTRPGVEVYLWRPRDWYSGAIQEVLAA